MKRVDVYLTDLLNTNVRNNDVHKPVHTTFNTAQYSISDIKKKSLLFLKLERFISLGSTEDCILFVPFIVSMYFPACVDKSGDFSPFHSIVYVHPPLIYSLPPYALFIDRL